MNPSSRIFVFFAIFLAALGAAFLLPRFAASGSDGLAGGAIAAMTFLGFMLVAAVLALVLLVMTLRHRASLPDGAKVAGFLPLPLLFASAVLMIVLIRLKSQERQPEQTPPPAAAPVTTAP